jgi:hypothetical protein
MKPYPVFIYCLVLTLLIPVSFDAHADTWFNWWYWNLWNTDPSSTNLPPDLSGVPPAAISPDQLYNFKPTASDPEGDTLSFSITNLPNWASFNQYNGTLYGTPSIADVGLYQGIEIRVSDGTNNSSLGPFSIQVNAAGDGSAKLSWGIPSTRTDGTPLSLSEIDGFRIYMGQSSGQLNMIMDLSGGTTTTYTVTDLASGTYYFAVTTYDTEGNESPLSNVADKTIL